MSCILLKLNPKQLINNFSQKVAQSKHAFSNSLFSVLFFVRKKLCFISSVLSSKFWLKDNSVWPIFLFEGSYINFYNKLICLLVLKSLSKKILDNTVWPILSSQGFCRTNTFFYLKYLKAIEFLILQFATYCSFKDFIQIPP